MTREMSAQEARENWAGLLNEVQFHGETFVITRNGKPAAKVVPLDGTHTESSNHQEGKWAPSSGRARR